MLSLGAYCSDRLFRSSSFCCCIPVRAGFLVMSVLTFLLSGALSIILWFEVTHTPQLDRVAFFLAGVVETLLFLASAIGFVGVVARKQLFVMIYAYFLCAHFVTNIAVGIYLLVTVRASNRQELVDYCMEITSLESSCARLMTVSTYVFIAIVVALLLLELYGVLIAIRYVYRLRTQKRDNRARRLGYLHALSRPDTQRHARQGSDNIELLHSQDSAGDLEGVVLDIGPQNYMPVSTHDPIPVLSPPPDFETSSGRRVRALPPRPVPPPITLPNPHEQPEPPTPESEDEHHSLYTAEVSTDAHSALMDHASYMGTLFSSPPPVPTYSRR